MGSFADTAGNWLAEKGKAMWSWLGETSLTPTSPAAVGGLVMTGTAAAISNKVAGTNYNVGSIVGTGINLKSYGVFDNILPSFDMGDVGNAIFNSGSGTSSSSMFTDTHKEAGKSVAESFSLPFWAKAAIVGAVVIGTLIAVKGAME